MDSDTPRPASFCSSQTPPSASRTGQTRYVLMLLEVEYMPWVYNFIAGMANWILLAGYLVVPGTFTTLQKSTNVEQALEGNDAGRAILNTVQYPPLLAIACLFFALGSAILIGLYWRWRTNYIWLIHRIFTPIAMNAAAGLATTLINVYTARSGGWSIMALITTIMTGVTCVSSSTLVIVFRLIKLEKIKRAHECYVRQQWGASSNV